MSNKVKKILIIIFVIVVVLSLCFAYYKFTHKASSKIDEGFIFSISFSSLLIVPVFLLFFKPEKTE